MTVTAQYLECIIVCPMLLYRALILLGLALSSKRLCLRYSWCYIDIIFLLTSFYRAEPGGLALDVVD